MGESTQAVHSTHAVNIAFHGVRGSTPCCCPTLKRYGGNTSCVSIEAEGADPIVLDCGTGLRMFGASLADEPCCVDVLVTHLHWDHIQGLPFFTPLKFADTRFTVYGPGEEGETFGESFGRFMAPPFFPIETAHLPADITFTDAFDDEFQLGDTHVVAKPVPHTGTTTGFRVTRNGVSVAYVPDHQEPVDDPTFVAPSVIELCRGVDVLIHDAQFTKDEFAVKADWGHSTPEYAVEVARQAGVKTLVLFHHDPAHDDDMVDEIAARMAELAADEPFEVIAAAEGLKLTLTADG
ncbi:MAG: MBL fold metallo-hydrolase [Actinomycetota bacterium]